MSMLLRPPDVKSKLQTRLHDLGAARRRAVVIRGFANTAALAIACVCLLGATDAVFSLPSWVRAISLVATLSASIAWFLGRVWIPALDPISGLAVAQALERRFPKLNDALASAIEFLDVNEETRHDSPRLRRIAVVRAENILGRCSPHQIVPSAQAWRSVGLLILTGLVALPLIIVNPSRASSALTRLAFPYGTATLPTQTKISVLEPARFPFRMAKGDTFDLRFKLDGEVPEQAVVRVRLAGGTPFEETLTTTLPTGEVQRNLELHLESGRISQNFDFKIVANDADTGWLAVVVEPPPKLVPRDGRPSPQMRLDFPDYSELPPRDVPDGAVAVEAVAGSRVRFRAATDRRIVAASIRPPADAVPSLLESSLAATAGLHPLAVLGGQLLADSIAADVPVHISGPDGTWLDADFVPSVPGQHALRFTDETGLTGVRLLDFRFTTDPAPTVTLERPTIGKDPATWLPTASLPVDIRARDSTFAVRSLLLEYRVGGPDSAWQSLAVVDVAAQRTVAAAVLSPVLLATPRPASSSSSTTIPISRLRKSNGSPIADGDLVSVRAASTDWDDVSVLKAPGRSKEFEFRVLSQTSLEAVLQQELGKLRPELLRLREETRTSRESLAELARSAADGKTTATAAALTVRTATQAQQNTRNKLADPRDGSLAAAEQLRLTARANGMPRSATTDRIEAVADELARIVQKNLEPIERELAAAQEQAEKSSADHKALAGSADNVVQKQRDLEAGLSKILRQLEQWGGPGEIRAEARGLREQLAKAAEAAEKASGKVPAGKTAEKLSAGEAAELARAAEKFSQLAERAGGTLVRAEELAKEKTRQANELQADAETKTKSAAEARAEATAAAARPGATAEEIRKAGDKAAALEQAAAVGQAAADASRAEAAALKKSVAKAGGQELTNDLNAAAAELRNNNTAKSSAARRSAAERIDQLSNALTETPTDPNDQISKKKAGVESIDKLAAEQDELRKKAKSAAQIPDAKERAQALEKVAREQDELQKRVEEQAEQLTREPRNEEAAEQLREAARRMAAARDELKQGRTNDSAQADALDKLDDAAEKLERERKADAGQLEREKRAALADALRTLRDRVRAADEEAARIQAEVINKRAWDRARLASLRDLEDRATTLAEDLGTFSSKPELEPLPVFRQLIEQAAKLTARAGKLFTDRKENATDSAGSPFDAIAEASEDERTRRPLRTALRRLDHVLDALKDERNKPEPKAGPNEPPEMPPMPPPEIDPPAGPNPQGVPPLAQLRALRAIQAEVNERTRAFAKAHAGQDPAKEPISDADREEIEELEKTQRDVAELLRKIAPALRPPMAGPEVP